MEGCYKLFVGGLPVRVTEETIAEFFSAYGTIVSCKLKKSIQTGRSLGFAFIKVKEKQAYDRLLSERVEFQGRVIEVKTVWKKKELNERLEIEKMKKLFVSNIPSDLINNDLITYFSVFGKVVNAFIIIDPDTRKNKNYGYVIFKEVAGHEKAFNYKGPHMITPTAELHLERSLNTAEIAHQKQGFSDKTCFKKEPLVKATAAIQAKGHYDERDLYANPEYSTQSPNWKRSAKTQKQTAINCDSYPITHIYDAPELDFTFPVSGRVAEQDSARARRTYFGSLSSPSHQMNGGFGTSFFQEGNDSSDRTSSMQIRDQSFRKWTNENGEHFAAQDANFNSRKFSVASLDESERNYGFKHGNLSRYCLIYDARLP